MKIFLTVISLIAVLYDRYCQLFLANDRQYELRNLLSFHGHDNKILWYGGDGFFITRASNFYDVWKIQKNYLREIPLNKYENCLSNVGLVGEFSDYDTLRWAVQIKQFDELVRDDEIVEWFNANDRKRKFEEQYLSGKYVKVYFPFYKKKKSKHELGLYFYILNKDIT